jgi:hypothetical protein
MLGLTLLTGLLLPEDAISYLPGMQVFLKGKSPLVPFVLLKRTRLIRVVCQLLRPIKLILSEFGHRMAEER